MELSGYPIQTFWAGPMGAMEDACLRSWVGHGHPVFLYTYEDISGLPHGVERKDAADIIPDGLTLYNGPAPASKRDDAFSYMPFSDRFRFTLLRIQGGLWLDLDIILVRPIPDEWFDQEFFCSSERTIQAGTLKSNLPSKPNIGVIYFSEPEHPLTHRLTRWICSGVGSDAWEGMKHFTACLKLMGMSNRVLGPSLFCDMNWWDVGDITDSVNDSDILPSKYGVPGTTVKWPEEAVGVHLWRGLLRKRGIAYETPVVSSYLGRLYQQAEQVYQQKVAAP